MKTIKKIAIIGGAGRTGSYLVNQLLDKGFHLKLLLRHPETFTLQNPLIEIAKGDVLDPVAVQAVVGDCQAVLSTVGQRKDEPLVASQATRYILDAIGDKAVRYILLAGLNVDTPFDQKGPGTLKATEWMKATFPTIHEDRQKSYSILSESSADWILVRVPYIEFNDERNTMKVSLEDSPGAKISAGDIAGFVIGQLTQDTYLRQAPFIAN